MRITVMALFAVLTVGVAGVQADHDGFMGIDTEAICTPSSTGHVVLTKALDMAVTIRTSPAGLFSAVGVEWTCNAWSSPMTSSGGEIVYVGTETDPDGSVYDVWTFSDRKLLPSFAGPTYATYTPGGGQTYTYSTDLGLKVWASIDGVNPSVWDLECVTDAWDDDLNVWVGDSDDH